MTVELRDGLARAFQNDRSGPATDENPDGTPYFTVTSVNDTSVACLPSVFLQCSGRVVAGTTRSLRSLIRVVVLHSPMDETEPWEDVQPHLDKALEIIYRVPGAFPEVLPINPATIKTQDRSEKEFSASVIQVLSS